MNIVFTDIAKARLKDIYIYYKQEASLKVAQSIKDTIIDEIRKLKKHPELGNEEAGLSHLNHVYRKLIIGNYKAIYRIIDNTIIIDTIFDSRQEPKELTKEVKKKK
jgi:toxin ParE1/3/4